MVAEKRSENPTVDVSSAANGKSPRPEIRKSRAIHFPRENEKLTNRGRSDDGARREDDVPTGA